MDEVVAAPVRLDGLHERPPAREERARRLLHRLQSLRHPGAEHRTVSYDLVGHPPSYSYALVFPFHTATREVTLVWEWCQAPNAFMWGLPGGCYEPGKHATLEAAARDELSEEAHLFRELVIATTRSRL